MTIQRQYILPNCSLVLEGLSTDTSNVLSILANAEFKIIGLEKPLAGGSDFFKALVHAVSAYCQRLLSGLDHPNHMLGSQALVAVEPDEGQYHRLMIKPELLEDVSTEKSDVLQTIRLSTVQLFDMAEAIDQFYADAQTLPDLSVELAPLSRKHVRSSEPLAQRAIPPLLGFGTLAVAACGLFFLPVPELVEPEGLDQETTALEESVAGDGEESEQSEAGAETAEEEETPTVEETEPPIQQNTAITDSDQLTALQQQVQQQISNSLPDNTTFEQPLRYQISVAENGDIVGYNPLDGAALENIDNTPLPSLTYIPVDNTAVGPVAQFDLTLTTEGAVEVISNQVVTPETDAIATESITPESDPAEAPESTEDPSTPEPSSFDDSASTAAEPAKDTSASLGKLESLVAAPIQDVDLIYELNQELRRTIINNREADWSGPSITYRVRLDNDGNITGYEPDDAAAEQYATDLKLPDLVKTAPSDKPQLDFLVVISENNIVEVNPWDGWPPE